MQLLVKTKEQIYKFRILHSISDCFRLTVKTVGSKTRQQLALDVRPLETESPNDNSRFRKLPIVDKIDASTQLLGRIED